MLLTIHRGSHEIGGSCVELTSGDSRIVIDIGMPLVENDGARFDSRKLRGVEGPELVEKGVVPNIKGPYTWDTESKPVSGLLISHAHMDHYGLYGYLRNDTHYYLGQGTRRLIELASIFSDFKGRFERCTYIEPRKPVQVGAFRVTPFLMDHSAFDAHAFLIEAEGRRILYSGDFRHHGRKPGALQVLLRSVPKGIDVLLLEGTSLGRPADKFRTEQDIENEAVRLCRETKGMVFLCLSSQNIDRLVSFFKAAKRTGRTLAVNVYTASVLEAIHDLAKTPYPSPAYSNIKVFFPQNLMKKLGHARREDAIRKFGCFKIDRERMEQRRGELVMVVRSSMKRFLEKLSGTEDSLLIYSMWEGYKKDKSLAEFLEFMKARGAKLVSLHTSGHADIDTLQDLVSVLEPKTVIPIHTFHPQEYTEVFKPVKVVQVEDGAPIQI